MVFKCWCQLYHWNPMSCTGPKICVLTVLPMKWVSNDRNLSDGRYLHANNNTQKKDSSTRLLKSGPMLHALSRPRAVALPVNQQKKVPGKTKKNKQKKKTVKFINTYQRRFTIEDWKTLFGQVPPESFTFSLSTKDKKVLGERNVVHLK